MIHPISLLPFCVALLAACDSGPGVMEPDPVFAVVAQQGSGQQSLPGEPLPAPLIVRVTQPDGTPAAGVPVHWAAAAGAVQSADATTDAQGMARATWRLPPQPGATLTAAAHVQDAAAPAVFSAAWLPRERADLVTADAGTPVRLLLHPAEHLDTLNFHRARFTDSLAVLPSGAAAGRDGVMAFASGRPPIVRGAAWTGGRDTLRLAFGQPVRVPVTVWIIRGPYEPVAEGMRAQMERAQVLWAAAGVDLGDVRWVDATGHPEAARFQGTTPACGAETSVIGMDEGRTNVYVSGPLTRGGQGFGGYTCGATHINMSATALWLSTLLAHEFGHSFGLVHETGENLMNPAAVYSAITTGQVYWAHVSSHSALPRYAGAAALPTRVCAQPGQCLDRHFDMP